MEQREFLQIIRACRRRMNLADFLRKSVFALCIGAAAGILFQAAAFFVPLYYADLYMILALLLAETAVVAVMLVKRTSLEQAALKMDSFGFAERIVTAYEHLDREGMLVRLQREDAMRQLKEHRDRIRIPVRPSAKKMALLLLLLVFSLGLSRLPSDVKDRAQELHSIREEAQEKEDEIEEVLEALEELSQEELTKEQQEALGEMTESLESSLAEYQQASSQEMLSAASQKLDYKYDDMSGQLSDIIQDLQNGAGFSVASAEDMQEMAEQLKKRSEAKLAKGEDSGTGQDGSNGGSQEGQGAGDGNDQNGQNSQNGKKGQNGQNGQSGQSGQNGRNGQNDQNGQNGRGKDGGSGDGRGEGSSASPRDYISVPNAIADDGNLTGNVTNHDTSEFFRAQNGLNWEGAHMSYEAVIGSYEQNAYEGIAAERYPSGMEDIIKEYFASFND